MPRLGLLTDNWGPSLVRQALGNLRDSGVIQLDTIEDFRTVDSLDRAVWGLINLVDVVVACVTKDDPNIYYEIGLAHGLGKPVILVEEGGALRPPPFLSSQRALRIDKAVSSLDSVAFWLQQAIDEAQSRKRPFSGPWSAPSERAFDTLSTSTPAVDDFRSLFGLPAGVKGTRFERWFKSLTQAVPGWDVIEAERPPTKPDDGFDLVIWNSIEDSDLIALGNPIAVECRAAGALNQELLRRLMHRAKKSGLKGLVFATMGAKQSNTRRQISNAAAHEGILAVTLDRDDLIDVRAPEQLVRLLKQKIRELQFGGGV